METVKTNMHKGFAQYILKWREKNLCSQLQPQGFDDNSDDLSTSRIFKYVIMNIRHKKSYVLLVYKRDYSR